MCATSPNANVVRPPFFCPSSPSFAADASFFAVVENALYVSDAHDSKIKHKPHYLFSTILSMLKREPFPNFVATWDVAATGAHCRRVGRRVPPSSRARALRRRGLRVDALSLAMV